MLPASHQSGKWETTTGACGESKGPKNKGKEKKKKKREGKGQDKMTVQREKETEKNE